MTRSLRLRASVLTAVFSTLFSAKFSTVLLTVILTVLLTWSSSGVAAAPQASPRRQTESGVQSPASPYLEEGEPAPRNKIDALVFARWRRAGVRPAQPCTDAVFVRRLHLDVIGVLPTADEAQAFLRDRRADKRQVLIDRLLQRPEFADYLALKWGDLLRVKSEFPINLWPNAAQAYHRWLRTAIADGMGYDRMVRELLTSSGSNFRVPQVNFYRALQSKTPDAIARAVALAFMGERAERWPAPRLAGLAGFFSQVGFKSTAEWKEEIVFVDGQRAATAAVFPDHVSPKFAPGQDRREVFADWLTADRNRWFAPCIVNRIWSWLLGRGIVDPPDDFRSDNPPSHPELLAYLASELRGHGYDLRHVFRLILGSATYQLGSVPRGKRPPAAEVFAAYPLRRLPAEVLIDAINQVTGTGESYSSAVPEPFCFLPPSQHAVSLPDGSITSSFLEMFGRPPRDTGLEAERNDHCTAAQRLHLLNSSHVRDKLEQGSNLGFLRARRPPREAVDRLYLTILSRYPTAGERRTIAAYVGSGRSRDTWIDVAWALVNSAEFLYRH